LKKLLYILFIMLCSVMVGSFVYTLVLNDYDVEKAFILGYKLNQIQSGSMEPIIHTKDYVLSKVVTFEDVQVGDIITYQCQTENTKDYEQYNGEVVMHRVVEKTDKYVKTKGDANESVDPWNVYPNDVISKVVCNLSTKTDLRQVSRSVN